MKSKTLKRKHPDEECAHHSASERTPKRSKDRKPERSKDRKPERSKDRKPERSKDRKPERSKDRKPERSKDRKPERSKDRKPERSKDRKPEHGKDPNRRNGVKQPQMTKGEDDKPKVGKTRNVCSLLDQVDFASSELPVSCGNITGTLDKKRLALGSRMKCIMSKNVWYTPREFEVLGGRANSKNWKLSVRCKGHQLSKLIQLEYLVCDTRGTRQRLNAAKAEEHFGLMKESTIKCESGPSGEHRKGVKPRDTDMDEFSSNKLPVTCGSMYGILYKYRFTTGLHGKCIRTKTKWLTPSEFEEMSGIKKDIQYWKRNIYCKSEILGKLTLGKLIQKGYLKLHKCDCLCKRCMSTDIDTEENDDECTVCEDGGQLICCEECPKAFHCLCHVPSLDPAISEKWTCTFCKMDKLSNNKTRAGVSNSEFDVYQAAMTPEHILKCEYILLRMYCKTEGVVFEKNPCDTIPEYSHIIENPMWLCRVKEKLVTEEYQTVGGFIDDVRLIFHNCARFNQETDFESIGRKLSDEFEEVMKQVFDISNNNFYTPPMDE
ncbi:nuclear body protein SP140-like protein isoform X2 [Heptranchias perlo]